MKIQNNTRMINFPCNNWA
uniref:PLAT domain-containing protein n=1 Tax=Rhizophora mucronata TaxID=61149 RepID=A0A2P2Q8K4_RHIMU